MMANKKRFEYAVGDAWLLSFQGTSAVYQVKSCFFRVKDSKEVYEVEIDGKSVEHLTRNRLHFLLTRYLFKKLKSGKYLKYEDFLTKNQIVRFYAHLRWQESLRLERINTMLDNSREYREIKSEISSLSLKLAKAEYSRADTYEIVKLKTALDEAKIKRQNVLFQLGIAPIDLKKRIGCVKCGDTGYTSDGKECACVKMHEREIREFAGAEKCRAKS